MKNLRIHAFIVINLLVLQGCNLLSDGDSSARKASAGEIETIAGLGPAEFGYSGDGGLASLARLGWVTDVAVDAEDNLYVADGSENVIRMVHANSGKISTLAGTGVSGFSGDGGKATLAKIDIPLSVAVDEVGNILFVDGANNRLRMISMSDSIITTVAGTGEQGYSGDGGLATAAVFRNLYSVAIDSDGNIYLADAGNNAIRKITKTSGMITTIAGLGPDQPGYSGDNESATAAKLNTPQGIAVDSNDNIYITDGGNYVVRKISGGIITTVAGNGESGYSGDGGAATHAKMLPAAGLAMDDEGNIYIPDTGNNVVRMVNALTGIISTIAGNGMAGYAGDGGNATSAKLSSPYGIALDSNGNLFIADSNNGCIRVVIK